jgi:acetyltransferase-like isoleucine patch superfamily enzyme
MSAKTTLPHDWFPRALPSNVVIGERSWCYSSFSFLHFRSRRLRGVIIGNDTGIYHGTFFDLGPEGEVEIGDYCTIVGAIFATNSRVTVGNYSFIAHEVVLADCFAATPQQEGSPHKTRSADNQVRALQPHRFEKNVPKTFTEAQIAASASHAEQNLPRPVAIEIGENSWIGARAVLLKGARVGSGAIIGAAAVVDFDVPPYAIVGGNPARVVGWAKGARA